MCDKMRYPHIFDEIPQESLRRFKGKTVSPIFLIHNPTNLTNSIIKINADRADMQILV